MTSGDFNGDGIQDIAAADTLTNSVFLLLGAGDGTFEVQAVSFGVSGVPRGIVASYLKGDGKPGLAVGANPGFDALFNTSK